MLPKLLCFLGFLGSLQSLYVFEMIGLYSICHGVDNLTSNFTRQGRLINFYVSQIPTIDYRAVDVCYNQSAMLQFTTDIVLTPTHNTEIPHLNESGKSVDAIIVHLPTEMFTLLMSVFSIADIMIIKLSRDIELPAYFTERLGFDITFPTIGIENVINTYWEEIIFVQIKSDDKASLASFENLVFNLKKGGKTCLKILSFDGSMQANKRLQDLLDEELNEKIVLFLVPNNETFKIPNPILTLNKSLIISSIDADPINNAGLNKTSIIIADFFSYFRLLANQIVSSSIEIPIFPPELAKEYVLTNRLQVMSIYSFLYFLSYISIHQSIEGPAVKDKTEYRKFVSANLMGLRNNDFKGFESQTKSKIHVDTLKNKCHQVNCTPGFQKSFGRNLATVWDEMIGYFCIPCPDNTYKQSYGDGPCQTCHSFYIPSLDKTQCVDPLIPVFLNRNRGISIVIIFVCAGGALLSIISLGVYFKYWRTPVVKTSDAYLSCLHLLIIALTFIILPILFLGEPTTMKCIVRLFVNGFLYNNNINMILTKSLKLIEAFATKTKVTDRKVFKTFLKQMSILFVNTGVALLIILVLMYKTTPTKSESINLEEGQREQFCNTGPHLNILFSFSICLHLACCYRAYQCRRLPGYLNEATTMVLASFIATVSFAVMYPIYHFQKNHIDGSLVHLIVLCSNNLVILLLVYSYKICIIIFHPQKNTKRFLRQMQLQEMQKNTGRLTAFSVFDGSVLRESVK